MPLPGGKLLRYGIDSGLPLMFSENALARYQGGRFRGFNLAAAAAIPPACDAALDSAGFTAAAHYGDYTFDVDDYLELVAARPWAFWSSMDYCCEQQIAPDMAMRRLRVDATIRRYWECSETAARRSLPPPLPVLQGREPDEYARCAEQMGIGNHTALVGIGSVCRRHLHGPDGILSIFAALDTVLPIGCKVHAFGLKGAGTLGLLVRAFPGRLASSDSMAWDMGVRREMPTGRTQERRALAMIDWHQREVRQLGAPARFAPVCTPPSRDLSVSEVALRAVGSAHGDLLLSGDLEYRDARKHIGLDTAVVRWLIQEQGPQAFAEEEPANDYGLGTLVYDAVRQALAASGHLP